MFSIYSFFSLPTLRVCSQIGILEQFLASTFRPSDSICIHIDAKAEDKVWNAAKAVINCYK